MNAWMAQWSAGLDFDVGVFGRDRLSWRRAPGGGEAAVEVAPLAFASASVGVGVALRQAGWPDGPALLFTVGEWRAFVAGAREGNFDDLIGTGSADGQQ